MDCHFNWDFNFPGHLTVSSRICELCLADWNHCDRASPAFSTLFRGGWTAERKDKKRVQKEGSKSRQAGSLDGLAWKYALMVRRRVWYCIGQRLGQRC